MTQAQAIYLKDYLPPAFLIDTTDLVFDLRDHFTEVTATLKVRRNPSASGGGPLVLNGQDMILQSVSVDGQKLSADEYELGPESLTLSVADEATIECVTHIKPHLNKALEGLYQSSGMYCTQCEAEGFRRITYYLDRPDVMSEFTTTIHANETRFPVLLSNGNKIEVGKSAPDRHWVKWHDPFKKPAYLFALVAGDLKSVSDQFKTMSGRVVDLVIYVEEKDLDKCAHAMASLKKAMAWDEDVYGREYDLDLFMIVAVDDFNMGAMENKGLNIFNTSCVLANPATTTDMGYDRVESVVAHEYFHNWSGNRVTCRDWFQLSLKEGFTVFRDSEFSSDMGSRTVKRVEDVKLLRTSQFAEDAGPMSHPVQPQSYIEISNFYTLTVYEKGAEIVRMLHTLLGPELFRKATDYYFETYDGQAVTINEFVHAMEWASGRDLSQFMLWYQHAGTPQVNIDSHYDHQAQQYSITVRQNTSAGKPFHFPLAIGLVDDHGELTSNCTTHTINNGVIEVVNAEETITFEQVQSLPTPSLFRNFSAPVRVNYSYSNDDYARLMEHDGDGFNRWNASQALAVSVMNQIQAGEGVASASADLINAFEKVLTNDALDPAMVALMLTLPSEAYLSEVASIIDVRAIHESRKQLSQHIAETLQKPLLKVYQKSCSKKPYEFDAKSVAERAIKNRALGYLILLDDSNVVSLCTDQYYDQHNMTDSLAALTYLAHAHRESLFEVRDDMLEDFYQRWHHEALVVNLWLSVQATIPSESALATVKGLMEHPSYDALNPNKVRALIGHYSNQNPIGFHNVAGYEFLAQQVIKLDQANPQMAARIVTPLTRYKRYQEREQMGMKSALESIAEVSTLSKDLFEVVSKSLQH